MGSTGGESGEGAAGWPAAAAWPEAGAASPAAGAASPAVTACSVESLTACSALVLTGPRKYFTTD